MNTTDLTLGNRPMSAKELTDKAGQFDWNPRIGFKYWARAAETIHHEVRLSLACPGTMLPLTHPPPTGSGLST